MKFIFNQTYESILGYYDRIDKNGDSDGNYTLLSLNDSKDIKLLKMKPVGIFKKSENSDLPELAILDKIIWLNNDAPKDETECGFNNEKCRFKLDVLEVITGTVVFLSLFVVFYFLLRYFRYEAKLESQLWKVDFREVIVLNLKKDQTSQEVKNKIAVSLIHKLEKK